MIRKTVSVLSALVALLLYLVLIVGVVIGWLWVTAAASQQTHWTIGAAIFVLGLCAGQRYDILQGLWSRIDAELERRIE